MDPKRIARANIGRVSMTLRSAHPDLEEAVRDIVPARAREHVGDHWVIFGSAVDDVLGRLTAAGWTVVRWPAYYGAAGA